MRITCLFNPISGRGRSAAEADRLARGLRDAGYEVRQLETRPPGEADSGWLAQGLAGTDLLVVLGGDGAVRLAAPTAAALGVPLHHAAAGTENLFSKSFGMRSDVASLQAAIEAWTVRRIDLGCVRIGEASVVEESFAIMASIGFDAAVVHDLAANRHGSITHWSYLRPILRQLRSWRPPRLRIDVDGETIADGPAFAMVSNLPDYARGLNPARWADPTDGLLDALAFPTSNTRELFGWAVRLAMGQHLADHRLAYRVGRRIVIESPDPFVLQLDGDAIGSGAVHRVECGIVPSALSVLLPADR